jgi:hypothetical protein
MLAAFHWVERNLHIKRGASVFKKIHIIVSRFRILAIFKHKIAALAFADANQRETAEANRKNIGSLLSTQGYAGDLSYGHQLTFMKGCRCARISGGGRRSDKCLYRVALIFRSVIVILRTKRVMRSCNVIIAPIRDTTAVRKSNRIGGSQGMHCPL